LFAIAIDTNVLYGCTDAPALELLVNMSPSAIDLEIQSLSSSEELSVVMRFLRRSFKAHDNFELLQAVLNVLLNVCARLCALSLVVCLFVCLCHTCWY
jgi:hypothetical protein